MSGHTARQAGGTDPPPPAAHPLVPASPLGLEVSALPTPHLPQRKESQVSSPTGQPAASERPQQPPAPALRVLGDIPGGRQPSLRGAASVLVTLTRGRCFSSGDAGGLPEPRSGRETIAGQKRRGSRVRGRGAMRQSGSCMQENHLLFPACPFSADLAHLSLTQQLGSPGPLPGCLGQLPS